MSVPDPHICIVSLEDGSPLLPLLLRLHQLACGDGAGVCTHSKHGSTGPGSNKAASP
jgi:hypothetical protein